MHLAHLVAIGGAAAVVACSGSASLTGTTPPGGPSGNGSVTITVQDFSYTPAAVTIKAGSTVLWVNSGPSAHTVTSDSGFWDSGTLAAPSSAMGSTAYGTVSSSTAGGSFQRTFTQPGTFGYHCTIHPPSLYPGFKGTIIVTP
jgi:plastocyanin